MLHLALFFGSWWSFSGLSFLVNLLLELVKRLYLSRASIEISQSQL